MGGRPKKFTKKLLVGSLFRGIKSAFNIATEKTIEFVVIIVRY